MSSSSGLAAMLERMRNASAKVQFGGTPEETRERLRFRRATFSPPILAPHLVAVR